MKENRIVKNAVILFVIALVLSTLLGLTNEITKEQIAAQNLKKKQDAYAAVFKDATFEENADLTALAEASKETLAAAGFEGIAVNEAMVAKDASGAESGYALNITTSNGYGGDIVMAIGVDSEGTLTGLEIISNEETAGLGANCSKDSFKGQFAGIKAEQIEYTKSGKTADNQIDAISSATVTTGAVTDAVNAGLYFVYNEVGLN